MAVRVCLKVFGYRHPFISRIMLAASQKPTHFGLSRLDIEIVKRLNRKRGGYFVELGASNGISQSNTLFLETFFGWQGLLIEPIESAYLSLIRNRNPRKNCIARAACVSFDYSGKTVEMANSGLMSVALNLETDLDDPLLHAREGLKHLKGHKKLEVETVPARTLTALLDTASAPRHIDLLSLDVEGTEIEVLNGIDFAKYSFGMMVIESRRPDALALYFADKGYVVLGQISERDFLVRPNSSYVQ